MGLFEKLFGGQYGGGGHHGNKRYGGGHGKHGSPFGLPPGFVSAQPKACARCQAPMAPEARFCPQCGTSAVPIGCSGCGAALQPGAKFCGQCGKASG